MCACVHPHTYVNVFHINLSYIQISHHISLLKTPGFLCAFCIHCARGFKSFLYFLSFKSPWCCFYQCVVKRATFWNSIFIVLNSSFCVRCFVLCVTFSRFEIDTVLHRNFPHAASVISVFTKLNVVLCTFENIRSQLDHHLASQYCKNNKHDSFATMSNLYL